MKGQKIVPDEDFTKLYLCDRYGWTEKQYYEENSREFIESLQAKINLDNEKSNRLNK